MVIAKLLNTDGLRTPEPGIDSLENRIDRAKWSARLFGGPSPSVWKITAEFDRQVKCGEVMPVVKDSFTTNTRGES
jgi:hypothetical protein